MAGLPDDIRGRLRIAAIQAPMFLVSGPEMVIAACKAGIIGSFPASNARTLDELDDWYARIAAETAGSAPWAANIIVHRSNPRAAAEMALVYEHKPELVITALGSPRELIQKVQAYGGRVIADVASVYHAKKAADAGADGLVLLCNGAGGYTGSLSPFGFIEEVRRFFDGVIVLAGGIATGRGIHAAEAMGADLAYLGTRFLAVEESMAAPAYKQMVVDASLTDILPSDRITGQTVSWLAPSLRAAGIDTSAMPEKPDFDFGAQMEGKRWKDVWAAGAGVGAVSCVEPLADAVETLALEYAAARAGTG